MESSQTDQNPQIQSQPDQDLKPEKQITNMLDTDEKDQLVNLFTDTDYQEITYEYRDFKQTIYALKTSSTDYDLTGQIIWKAADILSKYILDTIGPNIFQKRLTETGKCSILELGSGPGLCGLVSQQFVSEVVFSDYQDLVMDLIRTNMSDSKPHMPSCIKLAAKLDWCKCHEDGYFEQCELVNEDDMVKKRLSQCQFDFIIGSDIVYWTNSIKPLMNVLKILFERNQGLVFYICYIERVKNVHKELLVQFKEYEFIVEEIGEELTKPIDVNSFIYRVTRNQ
eukprot:403344856